MAVNRAVMSSAMARGMGCRDGRASTENRTADDSGLNGAEGSGVDPERVGTTQYSLDALIA